MSDEWQDNRRSERLRITCFARCRASAGQDRDVIIVNITLEGCCLEVRASVLQTGQHILIRLETGESLTGVVRWTRDNRAGILFDEYLDRRHLDYLRRTHSTFLSGSDWPDSGVERPVC